MKAEGNKNEKYSIRRFQPMSLIDEAFSKGMLTYEEVLRLIEDRFSKETFEILLKEAIIHDTYTEINKTEYEEWVSTYDSIDLSPRSPIPLNTLSLRILDEYFPNKYSIDEINQIILNSKGLSLDVSLDEFGVSAQAQTLLAKEIKDYGQNSGIRIDHTELIFRMISLLILRYALRILKVDRFFELLNFILNYDFETENGVLILKEEEINKYMLTPLFVLFDENGLYSLETYIDLIQEISENNETPIEWIFEYIV